MPHRAFIGIGSNLGDRAGNYREAIQKIAAIPGTRVVRQSSIDETEPVGDELMLKWPFLNGVIEVDTEITPEEFMKGCSSSSARWAASLTKAASRCGENKPRLIDLDLLFFDKEVINTRALTVPHPRLQERRFVLAPMAELAPTLMHPKLNQSISEMLSGLEDATSGLAARARPPTPASSERRRPSAIQASAFLMFAR